MIVFWSYPLAGPIIVIVSLAIENNLVYFLRINLTGSIIVIVSWAFGK